MSRWLAIGTTTLLVLAAGTLALRSTQQLARQLAVADTCADAEAGRWEAVLAADANLVAPDTDGRIAAECRCWALLATGRRDDCTQTLVRAMGAPSNDWLPEPTLAKLLLRHWRATGERAGAAALAKRAAAAHPDDADLLQLEVMARSEGPEGDAALAEIEARIPTAADPLPLQLVLAVAHARRGDHGAALRALGETPPARAHPLLGLWFEKRTRAEAALGRLDAMQRSFAAWSEHGGSPAELEARYAFELSMAQLVDPAHDTTSLLRAAAARSHELGDDALVSAVYHRLVAHLVADGDFEAALAAYDEGTARAPIEGLRREDIVRQQSLRTPSLSGAAGPVPSVVFLAPADAPAGSGATLRVSADVGAGPDSDFESYPLASGELRIERHLSVTPVRWVWRDSHDRVTASGSVWPALDREAVVEIAARPATRPRENPLAPQREADGRRRLVAVVLDCADWRLTQYLRARRELPVHDQLFAQGYRAVLTSRPALTAAAMEALVWPDRGRRLSTVGLFHRLGVELAGLASVGRNPFEFLAGLLPEGQNLFEAVGAGERVAINMLFSHGEIDAGRNAEITGPHGTRRMARAPSAYRALTAAERRHFPNIDLDPVSRGHVETIAAEFDAAVAYAKGDEGDLLLIRMESLDLLTHQHFAALTAGGQDDGDATLLAVYRYIDDRLGELHASLDADDLLIVMSDHGIRTAMEHEEDAIFVVVGEGVPRGRAAGRPDLRGVPRVVAGLLGVRTSWPDTGVAGWVTDASGFAATSGGAFRRRAR